MIKNEYNPENFTHPGLTLLEKLEEIGMGPKEFAIRTGKPEKTISAILSCESSITPDTAVKFENVLKIPARFWLNYQQKYNEAIAKQKAKQAIADAEEWAKYFPYAAMAKLSWVPTTRKPNEKAENLLKFFGFSTHEAWEKYYFKQELRAAFKISLKHTKEAHAISAWLMQGDISAKQIATPPYNKSLLKSALAEIKELLVSHPDDFFQQLKDICLKAGVKIVYTPCLPKAPINGCTRWIDANPVIQLSGRYKKNDIFWFTVFHEIGHILLHGKKEIFLEIDDHEDKDVSKEMEADKFASDCLLSDKQEREIMEEVETGEIDIEHFAKKLNTHPGIIVGRLQHNEIFPFSEGNEYKISIELIDK